MYHFFVKPEQIQDNMIMITGSDVNHMKNVLRMQPGEEIAVSNGVDGKEYRCGIEEITDTHVRCKLWFIKEEGVELPVKVYLFQGLPKADKMELIIQKAVELGVYEIIPLAVKRSVVRLDDSKAKKKGARWQAIAEAAAKQSRRGVIPRVTEIMTMTEAVSYASVMEHKMIPYELSEDMAHTRKVIEGIQPGQSVAIFIGPEGGFEEAEVIEAQSAGVIPVTLGRRILRTETAGITVLAWIMYRMEI